MQIRQKVLETDTCPCGTSYGLSEQRIFLKLKSTGFFQSKLKEFLNRNYVKLLLTTKRVRSISNSLFQRHRSFLVSNTFQLALNLNELKIENERKMQTNDFAEELIKRSLIKCVQKQHNNRKTNRLSDWKHQPNAMLNAHEAT